MSIIKPYTFEGGTKARASEVNANFDRLYEAVNTNITDIANAQTAITNLGIDKANIEGNSLQRFAVADATNDYDAVNRHMFFSAIANSLDVISGLVISKDSNNPDDTIIVAPGSCYDSTRTVLLKLNSNTSKRNENQLASVTYYVYIIGDAIGNSIDILISPDSTVPSLPEGYTKYRKIGYFDTDENNKIKNIYSLGTDYNSPNGLGTMVDSYYSQNSGYVVFSNGFKIQWGQAAMPGWTYGGSTTVYFLRNFISGSSYMVTTSDTQTQHAGDKQAGAGLSARYADRCVFWNQAENEAGGTIFWIAIGF